MACSAAQAANASGVVSRRSRGGDVVQFTCEGRECELPLRIWATSVPHAFAQELLLVRDNYLCISDHAHADGCQRCFEGSAPWAC